MQIPGYQINECLHESAPRIILRAEREADGETVALKTLVGQYPLKQDVAEIRREFQIARRLQIPGVIRVDDLVTYGAGNLAIVMELFGRSLADLLAARDGRPLPLEQVLQVAVGLARILGRLHEREVVHKDVVPRNVLLEPATGELRLIDFGISSELSRERQSTTLSERLVGSLPYISPEQTGRMNRDLDYRTDYYSLGVTLFELLTGQLPFQAERAIEWVHRHISQPVPAAHERHPAVPAVLSQIVAKLMAKSAEDRYQSSYGLITDLERCRETIRDGGPVEPFTLGRADVSRRLRIPQRLYGREQELHRLRTIFDDTARGAGGDAMALCLISGYSGVGKSALANELSRSIVREHGYLIQGKFDQLQQSSAYGAVALALRSLAQQLLGEPKDRLAGWRTALLGALARNGRLISDLVPELELIIGRQPPVQELPPVEAQNRMQLVLSSLLKAVATAEHPLVLLLDDLQWSDQPTLSLLQRLATDRELRHLLLIGAFRSNQVEPGHPLSLTLDEIRKRRPIVELALQPLDLDAVTRLVADTLCCEPQRVQPLSKLVHDRVQGNPFFLIELLKGLSEQGAISFAAEEGRWQWDLAAVQRARVGDNVADFMVANLRRLPASTQQVLQLAACIGNTFDLKTLAVIHERPMAATASQLHEALRRNLVVPLHESYRLVGLDATANGAAAQAEATGELGNGDEPVVPTYRFQHDSVQQAAYALIEPSRKTAVHLSVGRLLLRYCSEAELEERLIEVVSHLNAGRSLITGEEERRTLAGLNLQAGIKAQRSSASAAALGYLHAGRELLPADPWQADYELTLALSRELQQCAYLTGAYDEAEAWAEEMLARVRTPLERAEVLAARTRQYATTGKMRESIQAAIAGLALLGVELSDSPGRHEIAAELAAVAQGLGSRRIADLIDAPPLTDPAQQVAIRLLMEIFPAAFLSGSGDLFPYLVLRSVNISLRHGSSPESAFAYAAYGMLLCGVLGDPAHGYEYGRLAVAMNERFDDLALKARIIYVYTMFIHHWSNHWSSMTPWFKRGIESGYQSGDLLYLAYSAQDCIIWDPRLDLETATRQQCTYLRIVKDCEYQDSLDSGTLFLQMQRCFQGLTSSRFAMDDDSFDEQACLAGMQQRQFMTGIANYHIYKAEIHYLFGDHQGAMAHVKAQDRLISSVMSLPQLVRFTIISFLTRSALLPGLDEADREETWERLDADLVQMTRWAAGCAENFQHLAAMMHGELHRLDGELAPAMAELEQAIAAAGRSGFRRDEAMANELAAACLLERGLARAAEGYLRAAHYLYDCWGATAKVEQLQESYPYLLTPQARPQRGATVTRTLTTSSGGLDSASLDMASVMKASQAISGEIVLDQLWRTSLQILLENAGGQRGFFVVRRDGELMIQAQSEVGKPAATAAAAAPAHPDGGSALLPVSVINNVLRTGAPLVLNDAGEADRFASDPYIIEHRPQSIICVPISRHGQFEGAIYMENNLTTGAFTEQRVEVLKLLSAQAAISMENAKLYEDQLRLTEAQQRFVPSQFLESLGHHDIARVGLGEYVGKEMSVLFSDLRDFTPLAEQLGPRAMIALLNRYFSCLGDPIADAGGFIDSYNGDEVMALFGVAPEQAVAAGIGMWRALERLNQASTAEGGPSLSMGVGINTGPLVLGTVGSQERLKCGVVGDTVNLASRIEQLTKVYGARLLIGEHTFRGLGAPQPFSLRLIDRVAVKGKQRAVTLYEVLDAESDERRAAKESTRDLLEAALRHYFGRTFARAIELLGEAQSIDPEDRVLQVLCARCEQYAAEPPPASWRGFEALDHK